MKKLLFALSSALLLASCYEDKGNYDYSFNALNEIEDVKFTPAIEEAFEGKMIEFTQPLSEADTLQRVTVQFNQTKFANTDNLDFIWARSYKNAQGQTVRDTLTTPGYMDVVLPMGKSTTYNVMLQIHDRSTDLSHYVQFKVATRPIFKNSIFVLHGQPGNRLLGNIEKVGADIQVRMDAHALVHPGVSNPFANASKLMYQATMTFVNYTQTIETNNFIVFIDGAPALVYKPFGLERKFNNYKSYVLPSSDQAYLSVDRVGMTGDPSNQSDYYYLLGKDGRFATARALMSFKYPSTEEGSEQNYRVTAGAITNDDFVFWDANNNRFLHTSKDDAYSIWGEDEAYYGQLYNPLLDAKVDFSKLAQGLSPVGKTGVYGYVQYRENYEEEHAFFVFKDNADKYYLYELTPLASDKDEKDGTSDKPAFSIEAQKLEGFSPSLANSIIYNTWFPTNNIFYIDGANVIRYNVSNGDKTVLYTAPSGYTLSCMKFREENTLLYSGDLGRYLTIGMNMGDKGAVAEIKLATSGDIDESYPVQLYTTDSAGNQFGNIIDVQFVHPYAYDLNVY